MALGGGCEFLMHASRVLALESYIGLVEAGVGLIPAGGGAKFAGRAAALAAKTATPGEVFPFLQPIFQTIATAQVAKSARETIATAQVAKSARGHRDRFAREQDIVLFHPDELLFVPSSARAAAAQAGYVPPARLQNVVAGPQWHRQLRDDAGQHARRRHDQRARLPRVAPAWLCGGEIETGTRVDEEWLLTVERRSSWRCCARRRPRRRRDRDRHARGRGMAADRGAQEFVCLLRTPETQARIRHTLETGKPLRN